MNSRRSQIIILYIILLFNSIITTNASVIDKNDLDLAKELKSQNINTTLINGFTNDKSNIYITIFDENLNYRGYRFLEIYNNQINEDTIIDYKKSAKNECSISEVNKINVNYANNEKNAIDVICMQGIGNEGIVSFNNDDVIINKNYGKTDSYLVGVQVLNKTFTNVSNGVVIDNILYIDNNNEGSAKLIDQKSTKSNNNNIKLLILVIFILISLCIIIFIGYKVILKSRKSAKTLKISKKKNKSDIKDVNEKTELISTNNIDLNDDKELSANKNNKEGEITHNEQEKTILTIDNDIFFEGGEWEEK